MGWKRWLQSPGRKKTSLELGAGAIIERTRMRPRGVEERLGPSHR